MIFKRTSKGKLHSAPCFASAVLQHTSRVNHEHTLLFIFLRLRTRRVLLLFNDVVANQKGIYAHLFNDVVLRTRRTLLLYTVCSERFSREQCSVNSISGLLAFNLQYYWQYLLMLSIQNFLWIWFCYL